MASDEDTAPADLRRAAAGYYAGRRRRSPYRAAGRPWAVPDPMWCPQDVADVCGLEAIHTTVGALFTGAQAPGNTLWEANQAV